MKYTLNNAALCFLVMIHTVHMGDQIQRFAGISRLIVIPGDQLDKPVGQCDAGLGVKDAGTCFMGPSQAARTAAQISS